MSLRSPKNSLSAQQRRCAEILAFNDEYRMSHEQIAEELGVNVRTIYRWKKEREFIEYQNELAEKAMDSFLAKAYEIIREISLKGKSDSAKLKALELLLKNRGKLTDVQKAEVDIKDQRSQDAIEDEIERLRRELGQ